jgi:tellurite resistance protein TehA-like permease
MSGYAIGYGLLAFGLFWLVVAVVLIIRERRLRRAVDRTYRAAQRFTDGRPGKRERYDIW